MLVLELMVCLAVLTPAFCLNGNAKAISNKKAIGQGVSLTVKSPKQCLHLCNIHPKCDAVNYDPFTNKCRFFLRCSPYTLLEETDSFMHFSKRPPINEDGYVYDEQSDSCLKVVTEQTDYQEADKICHNMNGRLVALTQPDINMRAASLLKNSNVQYAWIGLTDQRLEGNPRHTNGARVSQTGFFPLAVQGHRNNTRRNCWSLTDTGTWSEHSCKERKQYSICQIISF